MCKLSIQSFRPSDGGNQGKNPDGAMARHPRSVWWISHPAHPWFLLQLRQHDDLPDILHEVIVLSLTNLYTSLDCCRQHGSPDLTYADFIVVQSVWGMTQGLIMPLSGYISRFPPPHQKSDITIVFSCFPGWPGPGPPCCWAAWYSPWALQWPGDWGVYSHVSWIVIWRIVTMIPKPIA